MMSLVGCLFIMCFNRLPAMNCYWSTKPSMGNAVIKATFSRDRFKLLLSKLYLNTPEKPSDACKTFYVEELLSCLKSTFQRVRQDSVFQSLDESMTKFKGRSSFKQYMPAKPVKRGIKVWMRCDALTGYTYDINIYVGKEDVSQEGTLGERVVKLLVSSIQDRDVTLAFDRFFTSVNLMKDLNFAAAGTCMKNRKNMPKDTVAIKKGETEFLGNDKGVLCVRWMDSKEVILLSNCHGGEMSSVQKKKKDGSRETIACPEAIVLYRKIMGGVDLADQMAGLYDLDRKSLKWWKKFFYRFLLFAAVNSWVVYKELQRKEKITFLDFLCDLSESLVAKGQSGNLVKRSSRSGRRSKRVKLMKNVGEHLPVEGKTRRRCAGCARKGVERRTTMLCKSCSLPYCKDCFAICHEQ